MASYIYEHDFYPDSALGNLISDRDSGCKGDPSEITIKLMNNTRYVLVVSTCDDKVTGNFSTKIFGKHQVNIRKKGNINTSIYYLYFSLLSLISNTLFRSE